MTIRGQVEVPPSGARMMTTMMYGAATSGVRMMFHGQLEVAPRQMYGEAAATCPRQTMGEVSNGVIGVRDGVAMVILPSRLHSRPQSRLRGHLLRRTPSRRPTTHHQHHPPRPTIHQHHQLPRLLKLVAPVLRMSVQHNSHCRSKHSC